MSLAMPIEKSMTQTQQDLSAQQQFEAQRDAYLALPFERVTDKAIATEIIKLSALFAFDFQKNALQSLSYAISDSLASPQRDETVLHVLIELVSGECCTDNILGPDYGLTSHFYPAIEAALQCSDEASLQPIQVLRDFATGKASIRELPTEWYEFLHFQASYLNNRNGCYAVIGHCRELLLSNVFERLARHLPKTDDFLYARQFFGKHVLLDTAEGSGHADLMRGIMGDIISNEDEGYQFATEFLRHRNALYRSVLE
jgi:hypothetical protein